MKKNKFLHLILSVAMILSLAINAFAVSPSLRCDTHLSEDKKQVNVRISLDNAVGLQDGDLRIIFDEKKYEYSSSKQMAPSGIVVVSGKAVEEEGLCTCSLISMDKLSSSDCDENGGIDIVEFSFTPKGKVDEKNLMNDFMIFCDSLDVNDEQVEVEHIGNANLIGEHETGAVTLNSGAADYGDDEQEVDNNNNDDNNDEEESLSTSNKKIIVIIAVVAVAVIVLAVVLKVVSKKKSDEPDNKDTDVEEEKESTPSDEETDDSQKKEN